MKTYKKCSYNVTVYDYSWTFVIGNPLAPKPVIL